MKVEEEDTNAKGLEIKANANSEMHRLVRSNGSRAKVEKYTITNEYLRKWPKFAENVSV
jgi:hypothetical protein